MLPAVAGLLVALITVFLMLLAALRTSKGRKLLSKLRERAKKQKDDGPMTKGAEVRENDAQPGMPSSEELADLDLSTSFFDRLMVKLRILISMIQVLSQIGVVYSIPFPSLYANLLRWTSLLELNFIDILPLGCVMTVGFHFSLLVRTLVLPALLSVALAAKVGRAPAKVADFFNGLNFFVLFLIYPSTSAAVFATFQCEELSDGTRWLRADLSVDCDGDFHTLFRYYAGLMVIVYPLGTPLFYLFLLRRNRARLDKLTVNQALRVQLINNARASGDYKSGRTSEDKRQVPWVISEEERSGLPADVLKDLRELEHEDMAERAALPSSVSKLLKGYELRVCWFEIFECVRKLAVACLPVFFQPSGSASQLLFGLMVCFMCFGAYVHFDPFEDRGNDAVARLCQVQIFFSLLSSVALSFSDDENAGSYIDTLLVMLWFLPVTLAVVLESPLKSVVSALMSWLTTKRMTTLSVGSGTTDDTSTVRHGDVNLLQRQRQHGCGQQLRLPPRALLSNESSAQPCTTKPTVMVSLAAPARPERARPLGRYRGQTVTQYRGRGATQYRGQRATRHRGQGATLGLPCSLLRRAAAAATRQALWGARGAQRGALRREPRAVMRKVGGMAAERTSHRSHRGLSTCRRWPWVLGVAHLKPCLRHAVRLSSCQPRHSMPRHRPRTAGPSAPRQFPSCSSNSICLWPARKSVMRKSVMVTALVRASIWPGCPASWMRTSRTLQWKA